MNKYLKLLFLGSILFLSLSFAHSTQALKEIDTSNVESDNQEISAISDEERISPNPVDIIIYATVLSVGAYFFTFYLTHILLVRILDRKYKRS